MSNFENAPLLLDFSIPLFRDSNSLQFPRPVVGQPAAIQQFTDIADWRKYVLDLRLSGSVPEISRRKYDQVLRLLFMAWLDDSIIKLAELGALAALEGAIKARYPDPPLRGLEKALEYLVKTVGVTDEDLRCSRETGMPVVQNILRTSKNGSGSSLSEIRNRLAHGDPFEIMPWAGLFEVVRDLIDFMYPPPAESTAS